MGRVPREGGGKGRRGKGKGEEGREGEGLSPQNENSGYGFERRPVS